MLPLGPLQQVEPCAGDRGARCPKPSQNHEHQFHKLSTFSVHRGDQGRSECRGLVPSHGKVLGVKYKDFSMEHGMMMTALCASAWNHSGEMETKETYRSVYISV